MNTNTQYPVLTFQVANQAYGLPVSDVVQIIEMVTITALPQMPQAVQGVINQHGRIVPVLDLRLFLGLPFQSYRLRTPMILIEAEERPLALVADQVEAVVEIGAAELDAGNGLPEPLKLATANLIGIARVAHRLVPILNAAMFLSDEEYGRLFVSGGGN